MINKWIGEKKLFELDDDRIVYKDGWACPNCGEWQNLGNRIPYCPHCGRLNVIDGEERAEPCGLYECFHCGARAVVLDSDFDFEDFCYDGNGIVHTLHCDNCGAEIEYRIYCGDEDEE